MAKQVPVYLFTGFLESGKTKFAQQTLEDASFNNGDRILLLVCEEGVEEYDPSTFAAPTVFTETIESESDLTTENLAALLKKHRCSYVMVEYNGMWTLAINRRCDIAFETPDGKISYDDIELPLPYDLNAPVCEIGDADYALFLQDIMDQPEKYRNKTVSLKGKAITKSRSLKNG